LKPALSFEEEPPGDGSGCRGHEESAVGEIGLFRSEINGKSRHERLKYVTDEQRCASAQDNHGNDRPVLSNGA
jgi:hypothetical protein